MSYIDGYVIPLPKKNLKSYTAMARLGAKVWRDHGALEVRECVGEDLKGPFGLTFPKALKLKAGETVVFSWIVFKSRAHRDRVNARAIKDPRLDAFAGSKAMPFDARRMVVGGFRTIAHR